MANYHIHKGQKSTAKGVSLGPPHLRLCLNACHVRLTVRTLKKVCLDIYTAQSTLEAWGHRKMEPLNTNSSLRVHSMKRTDEKSINIKRSWHFWNKKSFQLGMSPKPSESRGLIKLIAAIKWKSSDVLKESTNGNEYRTFRFCDLDGSKLCNSGYHQHFY